MIEETLQLDTPENVQINYELAGIGSRFLATLIDQLWLLLIRVLVGLIGFAFVSALDFDEEATSVVGAVAVLIFFVLGWGYYIFFEINWNGQTPGKRRLGIRVIKMNGLPLSSSEAVIRNLMRIVDGLPASYGVGIVTMFFNKQARRVGDLTAGTLVIYEQTELSLQDVKDRNRVPLRQAVTSERVLDLPIEKISATTHELGEDFLSRRQYLSPAHIEAIADPILYQMYTQMNVAEEFLNLPHSMKPDFIAQICVRLREQEQQSPS